MGDENSVIVIPAEIADEAGEMTAYEDFVVERVKAGHTIIGLYPATDETNLSLFARWRSRPRRRTNRFRQADGPQAAPEP